MNLEILQAFCEKHGIEMTISPTYVEFTMESEEQLQELQELAEPFGVIVETLTVQIEYANS